VLSVFPYVIKYFLAILTVTLQQAKLYSEGGSICRDVCPQAHLQEDLPIAGMAECDIWTIFFMFAVCLVTHIDIDTFVYFSATDKPDTRGKCVPRKWTCA
jgi:hypothetical protein